MRSIALAEPLASNWLDDARRGDPDVLAALYREHAGPLLRSLGFLLLDRVDAEDVVHDLFVGLPEALRQYEDRGALRAWLGRIAVRMALTRTRSRRRRGEVNLTLASGQSRRADADSLADRLLVEQALARLPDAMRTVIVLRDLEGWTYPDIAEFLGAGRGTIMTRHSRAMERLRLALGDQR